MAPLVVQGSRSLAERSENSSGGGSSSCWLCSFFNSAMQTTGTTSPTEYGPAQQQLPDSALASAMTAGKPAQLPEQVQSVAPQQQGPADCLGCRVTGLMLGLGGAGYVSSRLFEHPKPTGAHRFTLIGVSVGLFALGISRALGL